ncbi:ribosome hibernation factor-recruiting GTPase MRF [Saccharomonospora piscinae]|uniref:ribosome hibernation factor-recruiting GTPase MRF n=1 Tax=Saccharomonospora piscinae TaxID=687388 RepID=UPI0004B863E5|nr:GTP-binding protein [Saccharomonospora piscinae]
MIDQHRVPLVLIGGLPAHGTRHLADRFADDPNTAVVYHDLRDVADGVVHRTVRVHGTADTAIVRLDHGCVSCTLRHDLLPLLRRLARTAGVDRLVCHLDRALEPDRVCWELHRTPVDGETVLTDVEIAGVVTVLDAGTWLADATGDDLLAERGWHGAGDDGRTVAQVALSQVEFADVLVLAGHAPDPWTAARTGAVCARVAPSAPLLDLPGLTGDALLWTLAEAPRTARRGAPVDPHGALVRGEPPLDADCGVELTTFSAQRPFHPGRLYDALDVLLDGVVRTRGRLWVASRPDSALWLESAGGGLGLAVLGPWLDAPDSPDWDEVTDERSALASLRWHPVWGDRAQELVVVSHLADPREIREALSGALLTDAELAEGRGAWAAYPDPFAHHGEHPVTTTGKDDA